MKRKEKPVKLSAAQTRLLHGLNRGEVLYQERVTLLFTVRRVEGYYVRVTHPCAMAVIRSRLVTAKGNSTWEINKDGQDWCAINPEVKK